MAEELIGGTDARVDSAQAFLRRVGRGDLGETIKLLSEHVSYRVPGKSVLSGTFTGREAVARHMIEVSERTRQTFDEVKWEDWLIGTYHVAALVQIHIQPEGRRYSGRALYLLGFDVDNLIEMVTVFFEDVAALDRLFDY